MAKWTEEQQRAINAKGDLLISAGAGSGKTAVLTERICTLVQQGESLNNMLCVTFTNAAAAEMKKRIEKRIALAAKQAQGEKALALYAASRGAAAASISTFHAFCTQVLRRHFNLVGLDPSFRVADDGERLILQHAAYDEMVEDRYAQGSAAFPTLMEALGGDEAAEEEIFRIYEFMRSQPDPFAWLKEAVDKYAVEGDKLYEGDAAREYMRLCQMKIAAACDMLQCQRDILNEAGYHLAAGHIDGENMQARSLLLPNTPKKFEEALSSITFTGKIKWEGCDGPLKKAADDARKLLKASRIGAYKKIWCGRAGEYAASLHIKLPLMQELFAVMEDLDRRYSAKKADAAVIDYGDMEHKCLAVLKNKAVAEEYSRRYRYIFMDEYQDANPVQESILKTFATKDSLFLVGDVKQSIYRFRLAEPELFMARYEQYEKGNGGELIALNHNFRSADGVLKAVNGLFESIMSADIAELDYDERANLRHGRQDKTEGEYRAEFQLVDLVMGDEGEEEGDVDDDADIYEDEALQTQITVAEAEANAAAATIQRIMAEETLLDLSTGQQRPIKYSDFVVLLRSFSGVADEWMRVLSLNGIPSYAGLANGYFDALEVRVFLELLRVIDNSRIDISLAAALRSPIGGFDAEELSRLKLDYNKVEDDAQTEGNKTVTCWNWIDRLDLAAKEESPLGKKAQRFINKLAHWQDMAKLMSVEALVGTLLDETGYGEYCAAMPGGRQRQANLEQLTTVARSCAAANVRTLHGFLGYMDIVAKANALGVPQTAGANVVRIMSIHASKGLEFPYVIVGGMARRFNNDSGKAMLDKQLGLGINLTLGEVKDKGFYYDAICAKKAAKGFAEEMRVLYVAMTRAREKLIMICAAKDGAGLVKKAAGPNSPASLFAQRSFAQWVLGYILHTKDGDGIRQRYGLPPYHGVNDGYITAMACPAVMARAGATRLDKRKYQTFEKRAISQKINLPDYFGRSYAYKDEINLPTKLSVTGLAPTMTTLNEPEFAASAQPAAALGTAIHQVMSNIDLALNDDDMAKAVFTMLEKGEFAAHGADYTKRIMAFLSSPLGRRLRCAKTVRREAEFNLRISAKELGISNSEESVLLQGVIDCCFMEEGEWVLLDYKTDAILPGKTPYETAKRHFHQLSLYKKALERLTGAKVKQSAIYLFSADKAIDMAEGINGR